MECRFDLKPLHCAQCGAYIGELGTCEDEAVCGHCDSRGLEPWQDEDMVIGVDTVYQPNEGGKTPRLRVNLKQPEFL